MQARAPLVRRRRVRTTSQRRLSLSAVADPSAPVRAPRLRNRRPVSATGAGRPLTTDITAPVASMHFFTDSVATKMRLITLETIIFQIFPTILRG